MHNQTNISSLANANVIAVCVRTVNCKATTRLPNKFAYAVYVLIYVCLRAVFRNIKFDFCLFPCAPTGLLPQPRGRRMTRASSELRRSQEPLKKELTKTGAERRTAHGGALLVGAAGQRLDL